MERTEQWIGPQVRLLPISGIRFAITCRCGQELRADLTQRERRSVKCDECTRAYLIEYDDSTTWNIWYNGLPPGRLECRHCGYVVKNKSFLKDCPSCGRRQA